MLPLISHSFTKIGLVMDSEIGLQLIWIYGMIRDASQYGLYPITMKSDIGLVTRLYLGTGLQMAK